MPARPFRSEQPLRVRLLVSAVMSAVGLVTGVLGARDLGLSLLGAIALGAFCASVFAIVSWRFPEPFLRDR